MTSGSLKKRPDGFNSRILEQSYQVGQWLLGYINMIDFYPGFGTELLLVGERLLMKQNR